MSDKVKHDFFLVAYEGRSTADHVYDILRDEEKRGTLDIRTAAVMVRGPDGKIKLDHKRRLTVGKGTALGLVVGAVLGGPIVGAAAGGLIGASRSGQRKELKEYLQDKLKPGNSALALVVNSADWPAVHDAIKHREGEILEMQLTPGSLDEVEAILADDEVADAVAAEVDEVGGAEDA
jgi:uncharacterized membrane protein